MTEPGRLRMAIDHLNALETVRGRFRMAIGQRSSVAQAEEHAMAALMSLRQRHVECGELSRGIQQGWRPRHEARSAVELPALPAAAARSGGDLHAGVLPA